MNTSLFKNILRHFTIFLCLVLFTACPDDEPCKDGVKGTIYDYTGLSGCSWVIEPESGEKLEPVNMHLLDFEPADSMKIYLEYNIASQQASVCMVGKMVEITCISKRE